MNITIIGGGNIGTLMAAEFAKKNNKVTMYTSDPSNWTKIINVYDKYDNILFSANLDYVTNSIEEAIRGADIIWVTVPANRFKIVADSIEPYIKENQMIGVVPGSGGAEFAFKKIIEKGCIIFGLQRVHSIARLKERGKSVYMLGRKKSLEIGTIPANISRDICVIIEELFDIKCNPLENYLGGADRILDYHGL